MATISAADAVAHIKSQTGDPSKFKLLRQGFIDWKFGELAEHLGFDHARRYAESAIRWADGKAAGSTLETSYKAFLEAEKSTHSHHEKSNPS
jgi:hypothetical protein